MTHHEGGAGPKFRGMGGLDRPLRGRSISPPLRHKDGRLGVHDGLIVNSGDARSWVTDDDDDRPRVLLALFSRGLTVLRTNDIEDTVTGSEAGDVVDVLVRLGHFALVRGAAHLRRFHRFLGDAERAIGQSGEAFLVDARELENFIPNRERTRGMR